MPRPRLLFGALTPDTTTPFLPLPDVTAGSGGGSGGSGGGAGNGGGGGQGGTGGTGSSSEPPKPGPGPSQSDKGYPDNTPVEAMTDAQQLAYWKAHARKHEDRSKNLAAWKTEHEGKISDYDQLVETGKSDHERAVEAAKADGQKAGRSEARGQLVRELVDAEFRAAARGALTREQVSDILAPLDPGFFLAEDGHVDTAKVATYVGKVVPAGGTADGGDGKGGSGLGGRWPDTGGGRRGSNGAGAATVQTGRDLYARMKKPQTTNP